ncbi:MAG: hypothetical protein IT362_10835 [Deltaproteobacteria bacterium]|nr:hypothetical protein [Deltaproteobacteria bacterium]
MNVTEYQFDRAKPFYPLIMSYLVQIHGIKYLAFRGNIVKIKMEEIFDRGISDIITLASTVVDEAQVDALRASINKLLGPIELRSEFLNKYIEADIDSISKELSDNFHYILSYYFRAASSLLLLAYELTKETEFNDKGPLWEFLRHCRNAVAHNGLFHLLGNEPIRDAGWGIFRIEKSLHGTPLFKNTQGEGMLSPGDPIRLLWDIEHSKA